ncbi:MAG: hypothetical protein Tsb009_03280 [Planctomycetaceae bacterium]
MFASSDANSQDSLDRPPIEYHKTTPDNAISRLNQKLASGKVKLTFDDQQGYLKSILAALKIPISSQTLVYSKTSFQPQWISPRTPRALYFSDDLYVGWVQGGSDLEFSVADAKLGTAYYTLSQDRDNPPRFVRRTHRCLQCHHSSRTLNIPGHLVRSVYPTATGLPIYSAGTYLTKDSSPFKERWGGWYVTGQHGAIRHLGNQIVKTVEHANQLDLNSGANVLDLSKRFDTSAYLSGHSDIVALMVLQHQTNLHNTLIKASFETRIALHSQAGLNKFFKRPASYRSDSTKRRIASVAEKVVRQMLFSEEAPLTSAIRGSSSFSREFPTSGPRDKRGRSLRDFDLKTRLFRYPCSYLIYSESFEKLPAECKAVVYRRLWEVLSGADQSKPFAHLTKQDRDNIREILLATKTTLPGYWK